MEKLIISFSHSNYLLKSSGTEKYIRELSSVFSNNNIHHLNFFAFHNKFTKFKNSEFTGVILDNKFIGIYKYNNIFDIVKQIKNKYSYQLTDIHLQHLKNHPLEKISNLINKLSLPVTVFLHDYFTICNRETLLKTDNEFCGITLPNEEKCNTCGNKKNGLLHKKEIIQFLYKIKKNINYIIAPSEFVKEKWSFVYKDFEEYVVVRPHIKLIDNENRIYIHDKIRLAFVGGQLSFKGFDKWISLVNEIKTNNIEKFELFYFGTGEKEIDLVKNVYVSIAKQGENAMVDKLKEYEIDCAFVWPILPETYSYVYYELSVAGVFILTNFIAGNISNEVLKNKNGIVFKNYEECSKLIINTEDLKNKINEYQQFGEFHPKELRINDSLEFIVSGFKTKKEKTEKTENTDSTGNTDNYHIYKYHILTAIYSKKHNLKVERNII